MYYFYMGSVLLPIAPEKFSLKTKNQNKTITLINEGEVNLLKDAGLTELEFDVLIPAVKYSFAIYEDGFKRTSYFTDHFKELKTSKKPFEFKVVRQMPDGKLLFNNEMTVSLESYTITENVNEGFDLKVSIKLKQYKHFGTKTDIKIVVDDTNKATATVEKQRETTNSPEPKKETTYTVKKGDCLWNIAKKIYGDGSKYTAIYEANKDKITNPNLIYPEQVLIIPNVDTANLTVQKLKSDSVASGKPIKEPVKQIEPYVVCDVKIKLTDFPSHSMQVTYRNSANNVVVSYLQPWNVLAVRYGTTLTITLNGEGVAFATSKVGNWTQKGKTFTCEVNQSSSINLKYFNEQILP